MIVVILVISELTNCRHAAWQVEKWQAGRSKKKRKRNITIITSHKTTEVRPPAQCRELRGRRGNNSY